MIRYGRQPISCGCAIPAKTKDPKTRYTDIVVGEVGPSSCIYKLKLKQVLMHLCIY